MTNPEEKEDDDMTMAEREQWLRERGVQIENPGQKSTASSSTGLSVTDQRIN